MKTFELYTTNLESIRLFYVRRLGMPLLAHTATQLTVLIGWTQLTFHRLDRCVSPSHLSISLPKDAFQVLADHFSPEEVASSVARGTNTCLFHDPIGNLLELRPYGMVNN
ncbi:VOC family protein [Spirosoma koreense]